MPDTKFVELILSCKDRAEAEKIVAALLTQRLIACAKFIPIDTRYGWHGKIEYGNEVLLMMESVAANFDKIEAEVAKLHSYDTPVLTQVPIGRVSAKAQEWLNEVIKSKG
jgi:periplasmic divalent cation tolerance protein